MRPTMTVYIGVDIHPYEQSVAYASDRTKENWCQASDFAIQSNDGAAVSTYLRIANRRPDPISRSIEFFFRTYRIEVFAVMMLPTQLLSQQLVRSSCFHS